MSTTVNKNDLPKTPGPRVIRAWFDTVINPLLEALNRELRYIEKHDWSWAHYPGGFEVIKPIQEHLGYEVRPNYEQFLNLNPTFNEKIEEHDRQITGLQWKCSALDTAIKTSEEFEKVFNGLQRSFTEGAEGPRIQSGFEGAMNDDSKAYIVEYMINHRQNLPSNYVLSGMWNSSRDVLMQVLEEEPIKNQYQALIHAGRKLQGSVQELIQALEECRNDLSLRMDVPIIKEAA